MTVTLRPESCKSEGALLTGFISGLEGGVMTLTDIAGNRSVISETDVIKRDHSSLSIMPEGLLDTMSQQQIADLFAYLQN